MWELKYWRRQKLNIVSLGFYYEVGHAESKFNALKKLNPVMANI